MYLFRKNSLSFSEDTLVRMMASNAVMNAGKSKESPLKVGGSCTGKELILCGQLLTRLTLFVFLEGQLT